MSADTVITSGSSPSPNPAPSPLPLDLTDVLAASTAHAAGALDAKNAAIAAKDASVSSATAAASSATGAASSAVSATTAKTDAIAAKDLAVAAKDTAVSNATAASGSATASASSAASAVTAQTASESARDLTLGYKSSTQTLYDSVSAAALTVSGYATSAAASAASASAVSGLSNMSAAAKAIVTAADVTAVFIYDTTRDTDGGAWRDKCAGTSWMTETLSTATRGVTAKFPQCALIVGRFTNNSTQSITIYDLTDPNCPMWMVFSVTAGGGCWLESASAAGLSCLYALDGLIYYGQPNYDLHYFDMISDAAYRNGAGLGKQTLNTNCAARNTVSVYTTISTQAIASRNINSIAATVLPTTQPNPLRLGLPNPTVAVGTAGGVSIIRADGVVSSCSNAVPFEDVAFDALGNLWAVRSSASIIYVIPRAVYLTPGWSVNAGSTFTAAQLGVGTLKNVRAVPGGVAVTGSVGLAQIKLDAANPANSLISITNDKSNTGWMHGAIKCALAESSADMSNKSGAELCAVTSGFTDTTGWTALNGTLTASGGNVVMTATSPTYPTMGLSVATVIGKTYQIAVTVARSSNGLVAVVAAGNSLDTAIQNVQVAQPQNTTATPAVLRYAFTATATTTILQAQISTGSVVVGDTLTVLAVSCREIATDKSGAGNHAIINGTLTRSVVASGAEIAEYGGFSSGNFLQIPNLFHGATDACVMGWWSPQGNSETLFEWGDTARAGNLFLLNTVDGQFKFWVRRDAGAYLLSYNASFPMARAFFCCVVRGAVMELWINGVKVVSGACAATAFSNATAITNVGILADGASYPTAGKIAQMRFSTSAPTPDQIATIYAYEPWVFAANAKTLLSGSSNVQGMSYDTDTDQLAIATAAGTNVFKGLVRTQYISVAGVADAAKLSSDNHKAVSFAGGDLVIASAAQVYGSLLATNGLREIAKRRASVPPYDPTWGMFNGVTTDATPTIIASTPILEGRAYRFRATVAAVQYGGTATEKAVYDVTGIVTRDIGGNVVVVSTTTTVSEVTSSMDCVAQANTTAQTLEIKGTGKASTRLAWGVELEFYDIGLMGAAA